MLNKDNIKPSLVEKLNSISFVILLFNVMVFLLVFYCEITPTAQRKEIITTSFHKTCSFFFLAISLHFHQRKGMEGE